MKQYHADKQQLLLFQVTRWSYFIGTMFLIIFNFVNYYRAANGTQTNGMLSTEGVLMLSVVLCIYMFVRFFQYTAIIDRLKKVTLILDGTNISGIAVNDPTTKNKQFPSGEPFSFECSDVLDVTATMTKITTRQTVPTLAITTQTQRFCLPAIEEIDLARSELKRCGRE